MDKPNSFLHPERRLMLAVVREAIACLYGARGEPAYRKARVWLVSGDKRRVFSFENICEVLDWDAGQARRHLLSQGGSDGEVQREQRESSAPRSGSALQDLRHPLNDTQSDTSCPWPSVTSVPG